MTTWKLRDAEKRFSSVVDAALAGEAQVVTRAGKPAVVVLSADEYERLCKRQPDAGAGSAPAKAAPSDKNDRPDNAPTFVEHLLAIPKDDGEFERILLKARSVEF